MMRNGNSIRSGASASSMRDTVEQLERELIVQALNEAKGSQSGAARQLGISERVLRYKMKKYRIVRTTKVSITDKSV